MNSEVLIIGGGIIGLSLARSLRKKGAGKITILERGKIGQEASFAAAGMLIPQTESDIDDDFFRFRMEANKIYPQFSDELFEETGIDIELDKTGTLFLAFTESDSEKIHRRFAWQSSESFEVELLTAENLRKSEPFISPDVREGLLFPNDGQVENRKLILALQKFAELNEIEIREDSKVANLLFENGKTVGAETESEKFLAETVVLANGAWANSVALNGGNLALPKISPIRGQMLSFQTVKKFFNHVICSSEGYIVPRKNGRILVGATVEDAGFDKSLTDQGIEFLLERAAEISPSLINLEIADKWTGLRPFASDSLPILGNLPQSENLLIANAHYRNGILLAPLTAEILADKILARTDSHYLKIFSPQRFQTAGAV